MQTLRKFPLWLCIVFASLFSVSHATEESLEEETSATGLFGYVDAVILGVVEGVTEFLPISSTGHLIITNAALGLDGEDPVVTKRGDILWKVEPGTDAGSPQGIPLTQKDVADAYAIVIQAGAIAAIVLLYWKRLWTMVMGVLGKDPNGRRLVVNLFVAFMPAVILGLLLDDSIKGALFNKPSVIIALVAGGILMLYVEARRRKKGIALDGGPDLHELTIKQSLTIGLLQCVAMWPGTSRSMMTIVGGYMVGLNPARAAEFSFLLGLITLSAAAAYEAVKTGPAMLEAVAVGPILVGCFVAMISAAVAVKWMVGYLTKHGLAIFAWYRFGLAAVVLLYFYIIFPQ